MCGPSDAEKAQQRDMADFSNLLRNNYSLLFNRQSEDLLKLSASLSPTVAAGPSQTGMSGKEVASRQADIVATTGAAAQQAEQAARTFSAGRGGGGTSGVVSGIDQQIQASIASSGSQAEASRLNALNQENYALGRENYWRAVGGMDTVAGLESPNAAQSGAISGGEAAFGEAEKMQEQSNQWATDLTSVVTAGMQAAGEAYAGKCLVAAELYGGWYSPETSTIRKWLVDNAYSYVGKLRPFLTFYDQYAEVWASLIRTDKNLRAQTKAVFDEILAMAQG